MKGIVIFIFLALVLLPGCERNSVVKMSDNRHSTSNYDTSKTVICSWDSLQHSFTKTTSADVLSKDEFDLLDSLILAAVDEYHRQLNLPKEHKEFEIDLKGRDYKRQLIVDINSKDEKVVKANYFCHTSDDRWRTLEIQVEDGGPCYFNLYVNLNRKTHFNLVVNGFA
jgi:hypothetical protein